MFWPLLGSLQSLLSKDPPDSFRSIPSRRCFLGQAVGALLLPGFTVAAGASQPPVHRERLWAAAHLGLGHTLRGRGAISPIQQAGNRSVITAVGEVELRGPYHGTGSSQVLVNADTLFPIRCQFQYVGQNPVSGEKLDNYYYKIDFEKQVIIYHNQTFGFEMPPNCRDLFSMLLALRSLPLQEEFRIQADLVTDFEFRPNPRGLGLRQERATLAVQRLDKDLPTDQGILRPKRAIRVRGELQHVIDRQRLGRSREFTIWVSDDEQHRLLEAEVSSWVGLPLKIHFSWENGSIRAVPIRPSWPGITYQLGS